MIRTLCAAMLVMSCGSSERQPAPVAPAIVATPSVPVAAAVVVIPDTPAGRSLRAFLDAFDSGDEARIRGIVERYQIDGEVAGLMQFREQTGGFELLAIDRSDRLALRFRVKEKATPTLATGWITVKDGDPAPILYLNLLADAAGTPRDKIDIAIDAAVRTHVIDGIAAELTALYVYPDVAAQMVKAMRERQTQGAYDALHDGPAFATALTEDLRAVSHDKHLNVDFRLEVVPDEGGAEHEPTDDDKQKLRARLERDHCGFRKSERLDLAGGANGKKLGYLKFDMFADPDLCGATATAAFAELGDVDALIIDLRENGGGAPPMIAYITSYLFAKRTHLNDIYDRAANKTTEYWTKPDVPGRKYVDQPVYVLTSHFTFSGAEEFSYNLKNLKRATIIGEVTGGGAHPIKQRRVGDHFAVLVPFARAINPITKTNWEGKGVTPDVNVPADQALDKAKELAAKQLAKRRK